MPVSQGTDVRQSGLPCNECRHMFEMLYAFEGRGMRNATLGQ
jgi:hypothetical protein